LKRYQVLSLGAGVQSSAVLLMMCKGLLPKCDVAIFSDTQWEPADVYTHLGWLATQAGIAGIPLVTVTRGNLRATVLDGTDGGMRLPVFTVNPDGSHGFNRRTCTDKYKLTPIRAWLREKKMKPVDMWFGISADEASRVRDSNAKWQRNIYPLCGIGNSDLGRPFNRQACIVWLEANYPGRIVPRSACIGCPFHSDREWLRIKADPMQWADACAVDDAIRTGRGMKGRNFLHASRIPLAQVELKQDTGPNLFNNECQGMCGT
jgi:hypothetical protein